MNVIEYYEHELETRAYAADPAQLAAVERLQRCYEEWTTYKARRSNALRKLIIHPELPRGVYMWGGVGRGKSFLMDSFYAIVPVQRKTRIHFHEFMREVHRVLEELKGQADPLDELARRTAKRYRLICFDEFHVSDIADAMILYRLLDRLFLNGVQFVMTSNYDPDTLYPDGLHRDRVLPAIELIKSRLDVLNVDAGVDYRQRTLAQVSVYHTPLGAQADRALRTAYAQLAAVPGLVFHGISFDPANRTVRSFDLGGFDAELKDPTVFSWIDIEAQDITPLNEVLRRMDIDLVLVHQANLRIVEGVQKALGLPPERVPHNIERYGNTTAGTLPILFHECVQNGLLKPGSLVAFTALGSGLHWGAALYRA